jgi:hypothetical protein
MLAVAIAVTVRDVDAADTTVPVDALVPGETTTCLFLSAGSLGGSSPKLTRNILYSKP